jgi:hypothetical protein
MGDYGMLTVRLQTHIREGGFFQTNVTGRAAVRNADIRMPDLLNSRLEMALQCDGLTARLDQSQVAFLVVSPFAEMVLGRGDCEQYQQNRADHAEGTKGVAE